jgi:putative ABC transport system permease protein
MAVKTTLRENISIALQSISGNKLRTILTALIISIGIMALIGMQTAIEGIKQKATDAYAGLGANSFTIQNMGLDLNFGPGGQSKRYPPVNYNQGVQFKRSFKLPASVAINLDVTGNAVVKYGNEKTNPNISVKGTNESYLLTSGYKLAQGRNFSTSEVEYGENVVIIGEEVRKTLFKNKENALNKPIFIGNDRFRVIGVLESKGSGSEGGGDKSCIIPVFRAKQITSTPNPSFLIVVTVTNAAALNATIDEATALFRNIRGLNVAQPDNFDIYRSDSIQQRLDEQIGYLTMGGLVIGIITLIGAAIGLMNIMLVSVTERTREIGLRKSIGATPSVIRKQFLIEAIVICLIGGAGGIVLGIGIGNLVIMAMQGAFAVPWLWLMIAIALCTLIGVMSGYYPAKKAARLDPVEALRYE